MTHRSPLPFVGSAHFRRITLVLLLAICSCATALAQMRGTYTIGGTQSNFPTIAIAAQTLTASGVSANVTFLIRSGNYNAVTLGAIAGAGPNATITFRPDAGAIVSIRGTQNGRGMITMRSSSYVTFEGRAANDTNSRMTITNTSSSAGSCGVLLDSNTDNCAIRHCTVISNGGSTTQVFGSCIWVHGDNGGCGSDSNLIEGNTLGDASGTYRADCGVMIEGGDVGDPNCNRGTVVRGNSIINMGRSGGEGYGVRIESFCMGTTVANNAITITRPTGVLTLTGISDNSSNADQGNNCLIDGNRIWGLASTAAATRTYIGITVGATEAGKLTIPTQVTVINNMVSLIINGRREEAHGIALTAFKAGLRFTYHLDYNTVRMVDTSARDASFSYTYTTALDMFTVTSGNGRPQIRLRNNIWDVQLNGGQGWYIECTGSDLMSDYNLVSIAPMVDEFSPSVGYTNGSLAYSGDWIGLIAATSLDHHSIGAEVAFAAPAQGDLHIAQCETSPGDGMAQPSTEVTTDFDGELRSATPDIGADETGVMIDLTLPNPNTRILAEKPFEVWFNLERDMWVSVDISCDSGRTWQTLGTFEGFAGFSNVATPNAPTTPCPAAKLRVRGSDGRSCDTLAGTIVIYRPTIHVTAPNGGEHFTAGDSIDITWSATDADKVRIDYRSTKATLGLWTMIATNIPASAGTYRWAAPGVTDNTYEVRVSVITPISAEDASDNTFTVEVPTPQITVIAPNGREVLVTGSTSELRWNAENVTGRGIIEWSPDSGTTWVGIDTVADVTGGSYQWQVADTVTRRALLRVRAYDGTAQDQSDRLWNILTTSPGNDITVVYPNGGELLQITNRDSVVWTAPGDIDSVQIQYSTDGGTNWIDVIGSTPSIAGRNQIDWTTPALAAMTNMALVRVIELGAPTPRADTSDAAFSLIANEGAVPLSSILTGVSISPNPTHEGFTVRWDGRGPTALQLRNITGASVWSGTVPTGMSSATVQLPAALPAGVYLLEYTVGNRTVHIPVTVVR